MAKARILSSSVFLELAFLMIATAMAGFFDIAFNAPTISLLAYLAFLFYIVAKHTTLVLRYFFILFMVTSNVLGVYVIEANVLQLGELGTFSHYGGSLPYIVVFHEIVLATLVLIGDSEADLSETRTGSAFKGLLAPILVAFFALAAVTLVLALSNPFYAAGVDRFQYKNLGAIPAIVARLNSLFMYAYPFAVMGYFMGYKKLSAALVVTVAFASFLAGNKFGTLLLLVQVIALGFYPQIKKASLERTRKALLILLGSAFALIGVVFVYNYATAGMGFSENTTYLNNRLAQQGQLWWRTYELEQNAASHLDELGGAMASWFNSNNDISTGTYGIYKIMKYCVVNPEIFYNKLALGSRYAFSTQATLYYYFGFAGMLAFAAIFAFVYSWITKSLISAIATKKVFETLILMRFLIVAQQVYTQSDFDLLFSWSTLAFVVAYVFVRLHENTVQRGSGSNMSLLRDE